MKKYCFNCGAKWEFSPKNKPIFCSGCGKPTGLAVSSSPQEDEEEIEDDVVVENWKPNIQGLAFDFEGDLMKPKGESLGSLMGTLDKDQVSRDFSTEGVPVISKEEAREQFKKEAGALRRNKKPSQEDA